MYNFKNYLQETKVTLQPFKPQILKAKIIKAYDSMSDNDVNRVIKWIKDNMSNNGGIDLAKREGDEFHFVNSFIKKHYYFLIGTWQETLQKLELKKHSNTIIEVTPVSNIMYKIVEPKELKDLFMHKDYLELL